MPTTGCGASTVAGPGRPAHVLSPPGVGITPDRPARRNGGLRAVRWPSPSVSLPPSKANPDGSGDDVDVSLLATGHVDAVLFRPFSALES